MDFYPGSFYKSVPVYWPTLTNALIRVITTKAVRARLHGKLNAVGRAQNAYIMGGQAPHVVRCMWEASKYVMYKYAPKSYFVEADNEELAMDNADIDHVQSHTIDHLDIEEVEDA